MKAAVSASQGVMRSLPTMVGSMLESDHGLPKEVGLLTDDMRKLSALLLEPSQVEHPRSTAESWMKEVRELSYDVQDFLDELAAKRGPPSSSSSAASCLLPGKIITRFHQEQIRRRRIIAEISRFRARVRETIARRENYGLGNCVFRSQGPPNEHRELLPLIGEGASCRLVGIENSVEKIGEWLTDKEKLTRVISIVGPRGVGKTAVARKLYNDIAGQFECRAFVQASKIPETRTLLNSMLSQLQRLEPFHEIWDEKGLIREIKTLLQGKRYSL